ncbi:hypothetical protein [Pseudomonas alabamensis]|uniref:hypothetical protein n=1 Tax=Pseudomonas alabamensis TaxID=3064349 RepID=UPI0021DA0E9E|nr:hypothetical protein [Pseudomonas entomophila]
MTKRLLELAGWHARLEARPEATSPAPHQIAVPLFVIGALLALSGLLGMDASQGALGAITLGAGWALQRR